MLIRWIWNFSLEGTAATFETSVGVLVLKTYSDSFRSLTNHSLQGLFGLFDLLNLLCTFRRPIVVMWELPLVRLTLLRSTNTRYIIAIFATLILSSRPFGWGSTSILPGRIRKNCIFQPTLRMSGPFPVNSNGLKLCVALVDTCWENTVSMTAATITEVFRWNVFVATHIYSHLLTSLCSAHFAHLRIKKPCRWCGRAHLALSRHLLQLFGPKCVEETVPWSAHDTSWTSDSK